MSSAKPSKLCPPEVRKRTAAKDRWRSLAGLLKPGRYQATTSRPLSVRLLEEPRDARRTSNRHGLAEVRGLHVHGLDAPGRDRAGGSFGIAPDAGIEDVDPGRQAAVRLERRLRGGGGCGHANGGDAGEGQDPAGTASHSSSSVHESRLRRAGPAASPEFARSSPRLDPRPVRCAGGSGRRCF